MKFEDLREKFLTIGFNAICTKLQDPTKVERAITGGYPRSSRLDITPSIPDTYSAHKYSPEKMIQICQMWQAALTRLRKNIAAISPSFATPKEIIIHYQPALAKHYKGWLCGIAIELKFEHFTDASKVSWNAPTKEEVSANATSEISEAFRRYLNSHSYPPELVNSIANAVLEEVDLDLISKIPKDHLGLTNAEWNFYGIGSRKKGKKTIVLSDSYKTPGIEVVPIVTADINRARHIFALIGEEVWHQRRKGTWNGQKDIKLLLQGKMEVLDSENEYAQMKVQEILTEVFSQLQ